MSDWKRHLYERYVSSGQAALDVARGSQPSLANYPYYRQVVNRYLPQNKDIAVADVACGHGALLHCLRHVGYRNLSGVDVSLEQVALAHRLGVTEAHHGDMGEFLVRNPAAFDVVFLMDILEHLERGDLLQTLRLVSGSLKDDGRVIIHVPNAEGLFGMRIRYGDLTHENCFTPQSIQQALVSSGFGRIKCYEDKPIIHGLNSFVRFLVWQLLTIPPRLLLLAETGRANHILSQNMLVVAQKP